MTVNGPEHRSFADARSNSPLFERNYGTPSDPTVRDADFPTRSMLICFRTAEDNFEALADERHIFAVEADQLRPAEAAREAEQQQCAIPDILEPRSHGFQHHKQVFFDQRGGLLLISTF